MNQKLNNYVNGLFADIPKSKKAKELKEEMLANLNDRYEDYIARGQSPNQAYQAVVSSMGDVDELLAEVMPTEDYSAEKQRYRQRNAKNTAIAVMLYILGSIALIGLSVYGESIGAEEFGGTMGLLILLALTAIATGLLIYTFMSTPLEFKAKDEDEVFVAQLPKHQQKVMRAALSAFWMLVTVIYLVYSFATNDWHISWIIFPIAAALEGIIKTIF